VIIVDTSAFSTGSELRSTSHRAGVQHAQCVLNDVVHDCVTPRKKLASSAKEESISHIPVRVQ
jgi:hypothetical protein